MDPPTSSSAPERLTARCLPAVQVVSLPPQKVVFSGDIEQPTEQLQFISIIITISLIFDYDPDVGARCASLFQNFSQGIFLQQEGLFYTCVETSHHFSSDTYKKLSWTRLPAETSFTLWKISGAADRTGLG